MALGDLDLTQVTCKKMLSDFDGMLDTVKTAKGASQGMMSALENQLNSYVPDPGLNDIIDMIDNAPVPDFSNTDADNLISSCTFLGNLFGSANDLMKSVSGTLLGAASDILGNLSSLDVDLALNFDAISDLFGSFDLAGLIPGMDGLLNCLSAVCGSDVSSRIDEMNGLMDDMHLADDGSFDADELMDVAGLDSNAKTNLTNIKSSVTGFKGNAQASMASSITRVRSAINL